ncbi:MAG: adenylate/guanylate cyclase domain-containing protein [Spirochaetota bacterium]
MKSTTSKRSGNTPFNSYAYLAACAAVSLLTNVASVFYIGFLYMRQVITPEESIAYDAIAVYDPYLFPVLFLVPTILAVIYLYPFSQPGNSKGRKKWGVRLLNTPLVLALIGCTGWILDLASTTFLALSIPDFGPVIFTKYVIGSMLTMIFSFMWVYFLMDLLNRRFFIKQLFKGENLSNTKGIIHFSIGSRFLIYFITVVILPVFSLSNYILLFMQTTSDYSRMGHFVFTLTVTILMGSVITYLFMRTYKNPITDLAETTEQIRRGKYDVHVQVNSTDELGRLAESVNETAVALLEKELIKDTFGKLVDPHIRDFLLKGNLNLGGEIKETTILFSDIRNFASISERLTPELTVDFLNYCFEEMNECIEKNNGLINKYIGDAVLGIFGNPVPLENHTLHAITAAVNMRERREYLNRDLQSRNLPTVDFGIGIHSGEVIAGNIGSASRMEYTVVGDNVNIAARLEALTKIYGVNVIASGDAVSMLSNDTPLTCREIDYVRVKGKLNPVRIFEVVDAEGERRRKLKMNCLDTFTEGVKRYRNREFGSARKLFEECSEYMPFDKVSRMYIKRCDTLLNNPPSEKWSGIAVINA